MCGMFTRQRTQEDSDRGLNLEHFDQYVLATEVSVLPTVWFLTRWMEGRLKTLDHSSEV